MTYSSSWSQRSYSMIGMDIRKLVAFVPFPSIALLTNHFFIYQYIYLEQVGNYKILQLQFVDQSFILIQFTVNHCQLTSQIQLIQIYAIIHSNFHSLKALLLQNTMQANNYLQLYYCWWILTFQRTININLLESMQYNKYMDKVGTSNNPIALDENQDTTSELLETARNKSIIQQALLTRQPLDICFAVIKTKINGDLPTKEKQLNKAIINYFKQEIDINISSGYFHPKLQPDYSDPQTKVNPCELLLYGVDFLTTSLIKDRFTLLETQVREIVWINDSLCKLIYGSATEAQRVIQDQTKIIKMQQENDDLPHEWYSIKSYTIFSFERLLWVRYATTQEATLPKQKKGMYDQFIVAKKKLGQYLLNKYNAVQQFREIVNELDFQMMDRRHHRHSQRPNNSRSRDRFRNQRYRREFEDGNNDNRFKKNKFGVQRRAVEEIYTSHYAHRPVDRNQSFYQRHNQQYRARNNSNNRRGEYIDFNRKGSQDMNLSFNYINQKQPNNNKNTSFQYQQSNKKNRYDADLDSQLSFNHFGTQNVGRNNQRDDYNCDYNFDKNRPSRGKQDIQSSFVYHTKKSSGHKEDKNDSFIMNNSYRKNNNNNNSFNFGQANKNKSDGDLSYVANQATKPKDDQPDFFDLLNAEVSPIRQANQGDLNTSFKYDKKQSKKDNRILSDSFYQQDSY